jgi:predicted transposase/invertase (TIGR01784 family)
MDEEKKPVRKYKDTTFSMLFSEPKRAVELYNAVTGENLPLDTELTYTTLENVLYVDRNNDLGFVINNRHLVLVECQSTVNTNIPMRCLGYLCRTLENLTDRRKLYGSKLVQIPAPEFYVFYVGQENWDVQELRLSNAFLEAPKENSVELIVKLVNLNYNKDAEILQRSPTLRGYSKLLFYIREEMQSNGNDLGLAIAVAVQKCKDEGLLSDFLNHHSSEVVEMIMDGISVEEFAEIRAEERAEEAYAKGEQAGVERGAAQEKKAIALQMLNEGMKPDLIAKLTGLSPEEIESLQ